MAARRDRGAPQQEVEWAACRLTQVLDHDGEYDEEKLRQRRWGLATDKSVCHGNSWGHRSGDGSFCWHRCNLDEDDSTCVTNAPLINMSRTLKLAGDARRMPTLSELCRLSCCRSLLFSLRGKSRVAARKETGRRP